MRQPSVRFPFYLPIRCPLDRGQIEMIGPTEVRCVACGAGSIEMDHEVERMRAMVEPVHEDRERAARALHKQTPGFKGVAWERLPNNVRIEFFDRVTTVVKTLRTGLNQ